MVQRGAVPNFARSARIIARLSEFLTLIQSFDGYGALDRFDTTPSRPMTPADR
jgi:hypothetical protein